MTTQDQLKRGSDESASAVRETLRKGEARVQQSWEAAQEGFQVAGDNGRQMTMKLIEIVRANTEAFCNFAEELVNARDPGKLASIWTKHTQNQMEMLGKQGQELASLGQQIATNGMNRTADRPR